MIHTQSCHVLEKKLVTKWRKRLIQIRHCMQSEINIKRKKTLGLRTACVSASLGGNVD